LGLDMTEKEKEWETERKNMKKVKREFSERH
jgi:hypothetical protein